MVTEGQSAAQWAKMAYDKSVDIQSGITPIITRVCGWGDATCTRSSAFNIVVQSSGATQVRTQINNGSWSEWQPITGMVLVTGLIDGPNKIMIEVKGNNTTSAIGYMIECKL